MLSISNVLPLRGIPEGALVCNVEHHVSDCGTFAGVSRDYAIMISRNPDNGTSGRASRDYTITISHNPDNGTYAGVSRDYAIVISHNPDNDVWVGGVSHQREATTNDGKADDARHPPALPLLRQ